MLIIMMMGMFMLVVMMYDDVAYNKNNGEMTKAIAMVMAMLMKTNGDLMIMVDGV